MAKPRPSVVEKIQAKQAAAAPTVINPADIQNLVFAARRALVGLTGPDFDNVARSISAIESLFAPKADPEIAKAAEKRIAEAAQG